MIQLIGAISATQVLASTAYTTNITTSSGQVSLSLNSPALFSGQGAFLYGISLLV